jgi:hypothetical protein
MSVLGALVLAACTCAAAPAMNGWCEEHHVGYVAGIAIHSQLLYEALDAHGHQVDLSTFDCPSCREAIRTGGFCETHRVGFVGSLAYFSRLTYELARAKTQIGEISCEICRHNVAKGGWCDRSKLGRIGPFVFEDKAAFLRAMREVEILRTAIAAIPRCERCAVAIVTDSQCPLCHITYKNGVPIAGSPAH